MYHRYMPTGNGQYRRQDIPDRKPAPPQAPLQVPEPKPPETKPPKPPEPAAPPKPVPQQKPPLPFPFLEKLLPGKDSGDLLLLLILLLLLSEGTEDAASTVMTLAIFLMLQ